MTFFDYPTGDDGRAEAQQTFLPNATEGDWSDLLRLATMRRLATGETVISPGTNDRSLFIVLDGQLEVLVPSGRKWRHLHTAGPGSVVGVLAFFDGAQHADFVRATSAANVAELSRSSFAALCRTRPELAIAVAMDAGRALSQRMRQSLTG